LYACIGTSRQCDQVDGAGDEHVQLPVHATAFNPTVAGSLRLLPRPRARAHPLRPIMQ